MLFQEEKNRGFAQLSKKALVRFHGKQREEGVFCRLKPWVRGRRDAHVAQLVEHVLGKDEVSGSIPLVGSTRSCPSGRKFFEMFVEVTG